ncbi:MAG: hypothetical protein ACU836_12140 [Gammaproteobacteria bacterium]
MNLNKRNLFKLATIGLASAAVSKNVLAQTTAFNNQIVVGPGGDYADIGDALASITDNGPFNPYQVIVLPGIYGGFDTKEFVDVMGCGQKSTIIETGFLRNQYIRVGSNVTLSNMGIKYSGTTGSSYIRGAIEKLPGAVSELILHNLEFEIYNINGVNAPKYAVNFGGLVNLTAYNLRIKTDAGGLRLAYGNSRWHGCDIYLTGKNVGVPHYGVVLEHGNRFDWYCGRIGTGYYYDSELEDPNQDVIGLYIPITNEIGNCRAEIHNAEMFARNISPASGVKVNAVRAENGWARLYGCYCQTEITPDVFNNGSKSLFAASRTAYQPPNGLGGIIEAYGCRVRSMEGYIIGGAGLQGYFQYSTADNGKTVQRYENLSLCDAGDGSFTLKLANDDPETSGVEHVFKKVDMSNNAVRIDGNGNHIDGMTSVILTEPYQTVRVRRTADGWFII